MSSYKKYFNNPYKFRLYTNSSSDLYNYQMNNLMDGFYDTAMDRSTDGSFKAVCLSGIKTEDNNAGSKNTEDGQRTGDYMTITVKPLTPFGNLLPDPASYSTPEEINSTISLYQSMFSARSDYVSDGKNMPQFGQVVTCYFEDGSISDSNFSGLRFQEPKVMEVRQEYLNLSTIEGAQTAIGAFFDGVATSLGSFIGGISYEMLGAEHLGAAESNFAPEKFGPGPDGVLRKKAWEALRPFLPSKTVLSSVYRGQEDQNRIIKNYAIKNNYSGDLNNYDAMHAFIKTKGLVVARYVGRGHGGIDRTGAFDLSGENLDLIWSGVQAANKGLQGKVKFAELKKSGGNSSIIERENNCVHVFFNLSDIKL